MAKNEETIELLEVAETTKAKYLSQSKNASMDFLEKALQLSNDCDLNYKSSKNQRLLVELCLMQIASVNDEKKKTEPYIKPPSLEEKEPQKKEVKQYHKNDIEPPVVSEPESNQLNKKEVDTKTDDLDKEPEEQSPSLKIDIKHKGVSGLSLSSIKLKKEFDTQKQTSALQPKREEKFSQEELEKIWSLSVKEQEKKGAHNLVALLKLDTPRLKNGNEIHLTFPNNTNKKELEREKRDIMLFLGEQLKNDTLSLKIHVDVQEDKKFIYTPKDKYDQLVAINPLVDDFRKEFDLDL
jgi:DNA polymerase-3 subunit gamma/tau